MQPLNEEQLVSIEIDLDQLKKNQLNESWLAMFGGVIKLILDKMFSPAHVKPRGDRGFLNVKGSRSDVTSFARTLGREKKYLEAITKFGLDDPRTFQNKSKLTMAIKNFEASTGLKWPFQ
jgi:hypothetical protein